MIIGTKAAFLLRSSVAVHGKWQGRRVYFGADSGHVVAALLSSKEIITRLRTLLLFVTLFTVQIGWGGRGPRRIGLFPRFKCFAQD